MSRNSAAFDTLIDGEPEAEQPVPDVANGDGHDYDASASIASPPAADGISKRWRPDEQPQWCACGEARELFAAHLCGFNCRRGMWVSCRAHARAEFQPPRVHLDVDVDTVYVTSGSAGPRASVSAFNAASEHERYESGAVLSLNDDCLHPEECRRSALSAPNTYSQLIN